ncbi:hypothetical protein D9M69_484150 [compost metagenome]
MEQHKLRTALLSLARRELTEARESRFGTVAANNADRVRGAATFALFATVISNDEYDRLCKLAGNASYQRQIELIYDQPPYVGAAFAEQRRYGDKQG